MSGGGILQDLGWHSILKSKLQERTIKSIVIRE